MRTGSSDDPKPTNICLGCLFHPCNWVFLLLSIRASFLFLLPRWVSFPSLDHRGGPGVAGTRWCTEEGLYSITGAHWKTLQLLWHKREGCFCQRKRTPLGSRKCRSSFLSSPEQPGCHKDKAMLFFFLLPVPAVKFISSGTFTKS